LILVDIGVTRFLGNDLGDDHQSLGIVRVKAQHLAARGLGLVGVVGILIEPHRGLIEQHAKFAVGELGGKIVSRLLDRSRVGIGCRRFPCGQLRLALGLRWTLPLWRRRAPGVAGAA